MISFKLDALTLRRLDVLAVQLRLPSRGRVLDQAITAVWREQVEARANLQSCSVASSGKREDEILHRLQDLARVEGTSMTEIAGAAVERLYYTGIPDKRAAQAECQLAIG